MHAGMGPVWRTLRADRSVTSQRLARDTVRRVIAFARPHRATIAVFVVLTVIDAVLAVAPPLLLRAIIDKGIHGGNALLVTVLALVVAAVAIVDAGLSLVEGWLSA